MTRGDSPKEEGEISDDDDKLTSNSVSGKGSSGPRQEAMSNPSHVPKKGNGKSKRQRRNKLKEISYSNANYQSVEATDGDFRMMIEEYKDIRRKHDENKNDNKTIENHQQLYDEDAELMQLRISALNSARFDTKAVNEVRNIAAASQACSNNLVDNYDVVQMEMDSDFENNNDRTGISSNIDYLKEHIYHLEQKRQELTACQRQIEHQQNLLSDTNVPSFLNQHDKQPLMSIIKHNLSSTNPIIPLMSLQPYAIRQPLLPNPAMRGPLLTKPSLLPNPKNYSAHHQAPHMMVPQHLVVRPLMSINVSNANSINQSSSNSELYQKTIDQGHCTSYSPKPIEVIDSGYGREPLPSSQSSDFHNPSYSNSTLIGSSSSSTMDSSANKTSNVFQVSPKDPLYEDFEDDLKETAQVFQKSRLPSMADAVAVKSPSPSSILSLPHYEGLNMPVPNVKEEKDEATIEVKKEVKIEENDDDDAYLNHLKNKLLQDLQSRKINQIIKTESSDDFSSPEDDRSKVRRQSSNKIDIDERRSLKIKRLHEEEEDFNDMIVIDSDHETVTPYQMNFNTFNKESKPNNMFKFSDEVNAVSLSQASDDSRGEEMILRERLLKSLAAKQSQQATQQNTEMQQMEYWGQVKPEPSEVKPNVFQNYPHLYPCNFQGPSAHLAESIRRKKRRNKKKKPKKKMQKLIVPKTPQTTFRTPKARSACNLKPSPTTSKSLSLASTSAAKHVQHTLMRTVFNNSPKKPTSSSPLNKIQPLAARPPSIILEAEIKSSTPSLSEVASPVTSVATTDSKMNKSPRESSSTTLTVTQNTKSSATSTGDTSGLHRVVTRVTTSDTRVVHSFSKYSKVSFKTKFPNCEPIVIRLTGNDESEEDSDGDEDQSEKKEEEILDENISNKIESLLKEARKESSQPVVQTSNQSADNLPNAIINASEITRPSTSLEKTKHNKNVALTKRSSLNKEVPLKKDKLENLNKEELKKREKELEVSLLTHKIKQLQDKSSKESKSLNDEKVRLSKIESILSRKKAELVATDGNVQKIKEQLEAVLKILSHNQSQVADIEKMRETMRSQIFEKERKTLKTSNDITECQEKLLAVTKNLKSHVNNNLMNINKEIVPPTRPTSSNSLKIRQQQLKMKRKLSADNIDAEHPQVKRSMGVASNVTHTASSSTTSSATTALSVGRGNGVDNISTGASSALDVFPNNEVFISRPKETMTTIATTSNGNSVDRITVAKDVRSSGVPMETIVKPLKALHSTADKSLKKSKADNRKVSPSDQKDEKLLKIKDVHRKSTLRNHQPMQTTTTHLIPPGFPRAEKQLLFNPDFVKKKSVDRSIPSSNPLKRKSEEPDVDLESKFIPDHLGGILKSIKAFRTENEFASLTYTNKLQLDVPLCHFELMGKCNDDNCPWQHERNYVMTPREVLMEIVSYHPSVVPQIDEKTPTSKYRSLVGAYVDDFMAASKQADMKKLYLMMLHRVSQAKGSAIFTPLNKERLWTVKQEKSKITKTKESASTEEDADVQTSSHKFVSDISMELEDDALDSRYWTKGSKSEDGVDDGEDSDGNNNDNQKKKSISENTFVKKAFSVLSLKSKSPKFDIALKVLAKGIELYPSSRPLWHHYLKLFKLKQNHEAKKRNCVADNSEETERNSCEDISTQLKEAYLHALSIIPSYKLHWQFIQACQSFSHKMESCGVALEYLCSDKVDCKNKRLRSHRTLEVILHQSQICFHTGKYNMGMDLIEDCLNSRDVYGLLGHMTKTDRIILWMFFLHLSIFHSIPSSLFSPSNDNAGKIFNKTPFTIINCHLSASAKSTTTTTSSSSSSQPQKETDDKCSEILSWYDKASNECLKYLFEPSRETEDEEERQEMERDEEEAWSWFGRLIISKANLLVQSKSCKDGVSILRDMLNNMPGLHDVRIFLLNTVHHVVDEAVPADEILNSNIEYANECLSAKITYHIANLLLSKDQSEEALQLLERLPIRIHDSDSGKEDPNILYCKLLDLELPEGFIPPPYSRSFDKKVLEKEKVYFWLCYCLLLDLQGDYDGTEDAYNKAICRLRNASDLGEIWLARLERMIPPSGQSMAEEVHSEFFKLIDKSLTSLPVKLLPSISENDGKMYDAYDVHNSVINFCCQRISSVESLTSFYDWTLSIMPGNSQLAVEAINHFMRNKCRPLAKGFLIICLEETPRSLALWKTSLKLAYLESNTEQMRSDYKKSLDYLLYQKKLWKDFMLFEMVNGGGGAEVEEIVSRCKQLEVNIVDLFKSLSAR